MVTKDLSEAAVEFKSILENCSDDIVNKIPTNFLKFIDKIASKTYKFNYDKTKSLIEQNLKSETRGLIALVYQDYICTDEERKEYIQKSNLYIIENENMKREKYNPNDIFKDVKNYKVNNSKENSIIEYKKENFIQKIFNKIKYLFKK